MFDFTLWRGGKQRRWEAEKGELKSNELIAADEQRKKLSHKNHYLKRVEWVYPDLQIPCFQFQSM
jgi:hypothetical protein